MSFYREIIAGRSGIGRNSHSSDFDFVRTTGVRTYCFDFVRTAGVWTSCYFRGLIRAKK